MLGRFGFDRFNVELSVRDPNNASKYAGTDEEWAMAESALEDAVQRRGLPYKRMEGEAVFYGPKIDVKVIDAIGRPWQLSTIQFDFNLPRRFDVNYVASGGERKPVFMVHRALFGSIERFMGILTEHYAGAFPVWLAPVQCVVLPVTAEAVPYAESVQAALREAGIRAEWMPGRRRSATGSGRRRCGRSRTWPWWGAVRRRTGLSRSGRTDAGIWARSRWGTSWRKSLTKPPLPDNIPLT